MIQLQVLNKVLQTKDASLFILNNLNDAFFSDYTPEFHFIKEHLDQYGKVPDMETFIAKFPKFSVITVNEPDSYLISELYKDKNTRYLTSNFNDIRKKLMAGEIEDAMNVVKDAAEEMSKGVSLQCVDILRDTTRYDEYVERTQDFDKYYVSTGFKELDQVLGGWDRSEELATICARPNVGKSWILLKCAAAAAEQGLNVGIYSGEMHQRKVGYRIDTLIGHISNGALVHGNDFVMNDYKKYIESMSTKLTGSIKVLTPQMINGAAGVTALRAFIDKEKLDILFIDQHSLLEDDRKAKNPVEKAANISKDLKLLQVIKRIPIIAVSQLNRETETQGLNQIAQADRIGQDSTVVLFLEKKDDLLKIKLEKSRDTENGKILSYNVDFNKGIFTYIPDEKDANAAKGNDQSGSYEHRYDTDESGENVF